VALLREAAQRQGVVELEIEAARGVAADVEIVVVDAGNLAEAARSVGRAADELAIVTVAGVAGVDDARCADLGDRRVDDNPIVPPSLLSVLLVLADKHA
jgi:hypothetical protein